MPTYIALQAGSQCKARQHTQESFALTQMLRFCTYRTGGLKFKGQKKLKKKKRKREDGEGGAAAAGGAGLDTRHGT